MKIGLRDNICVKTMKTTCGSKMLENFVSPFDASIVDKLNTANVEIEKVNIKEFGIEEDSYIEEVLEKLEAIITTDIDGEIARNSNNGKVGIKPTFGLVSRYGAVTIAPSLEQIGVVGKDIETVEKVLDIIKGYDNRDSGSVENVGATCGRVNTIGYIEETVGEAISRPSITSEKIEIKNLKYALPAHTIISSAEASSNLARFDGIRFGYRAEGAKTWQEVYTKTRQEGFGYEAKKKMISGTFFLDVDNMQNYYIKAEKIRTIIKNEMEEIFKIVDVIAVPNKKEYTCLANLTGRPAVTVNGTTFIGKHFDEKNLIDLVKNYGGNK